MQGNVCAPSAVREAETCTLGSSASLREQSGVGLENAASTIKHIAWARMGGLRLDILMRGFGMMLCLTGMGRLGKRSLSEFANTEPGSLVALSICGVLLVLGGARLLVLAALSCVAWVFLFQVMQGSLGTAFSMQAVEYPLFPVVPSVFLLIIATVYACDERAGDWRAFQLRVEEQVVLMFRCLVVTTLFWVSFHKLNSDFLGATGSCEETIKGLLGKNWSGTLLPWLSSLSRPDMVIMLEGPVLIGLLLGAPRLGIMGVALTFSMISMVDAIVVTLAVIVPALAFLPASDVPVIRRHWKVWGLIWLALLPILLINSHDYYRGLRPWYQHGIHQGMVLAILVFTGGCQVVAWFGAESKGRRAWDRLLEGLNGSAELLGQWRPGKILLGLFVLACVFNGLCPYLGLKFEYSFAMLSNLRADESRWNHLVMPPWLRLTAHDPFVHMSRFEIMRPPSLRNNPNTKSRPEDDLHAALYSPWVVAERVERMTKKTPQAPVYLELTYKGEKFEFAGRAADRTLRDFMSRLPSKYRLFQNELAYEGPQQCLH